MTRICIRVTVTGLRNICSSVMFPVGVAAECCPLGVHWVREHIVNRWQDSAIRIYCVEGPIAAGNIRHP